MDNNGTTINFDSLFDSTVNNARAFQDGFQQTMSGFQQTAQPSMNEPRRSDGFYQQQPQAQYTGYGYQQQPQYQMPQTYGYGYTEQPYGYTGMQTNNNQQTAYYGFWNPGYGK